METQQDVYKQMAEGIRHKTPKKKKNLCRVAALNRRPFDPRFDAISITPLRNCLIQVAKSPSVHRLAQRLTRRNQTKLESNVPEWPTADGFYLFLPCYSGRLPNLFLNTQNMNHADPRFESCQRVGGRCRKMAGILSQFIFLLRLFETVTMNSGPMSPYQGFYSIPPPTMLNSDFTAIHDARHFRA